MLILLAVFWAAGSLLLAAESPSTQKPVPAAKSAGQSATTDPAKKDAAKSDAAKSDTAKTDGKAAAGADDKQVGKDEKEDKRSISEQAEAALKAAAEADGGAAKEPAKSDDKSAGEEAQSNSNPGKGPSPQRFVPSEQVRADFDVSFPIDI
jgi:hypothetical protein